MSSDSYSPLFLSPPSSPAASAAAAAERAKPQPPPLLVPAGHASIRMLFHGSLIGRFIGKSGSSIKRLQLDTGSRIRVEDSIQLGSDDRVIVIVAPNIPFKKMKLRKACDEVEFEVSAVQEAALRVFERVLEVSGKGNTAALCKLLVEGGEAGSVIGKGRKNVKKIRRESGARIRVLSGGKLPSGVSYPDQVVEIEGDVLAVKKGILAVCGQVQACSQAENSSIKESRPLESTSQSSVHDFRADLPLHQSPLSIATTSYNPAMVGRSASLETDGLLTSNSKLQQEVVFKILCSNDRVGGVIGRGGSIVHALQEESGANINTGSPVANCNDRLVTISSMEDVDSRYSPAQRAVVLVYSRSIGVGAERGFEAGLNKGSSVSARLVVPSSQVGCLLGKGGVIISEIRKATGTSIHIHNGDQVPKCVAQDDEVVEISGQFVNTQDALYHVTSSLRKNLFTSTHVRVRDETTVGLRQSSGTSQSIGGQATLRQGLDRMSCPPISHFSPSIGLRTFETAGVNPMNFVTTDRGLASDNGGIELVRTQRPATVTNTAVENQVPESSISSVYGENLSNLTRIRQIEGDVLAVKKGILAVCGQVQACSQAENSSIKESRPLESTSQSSVHDFRADLPLHQSPLSIATTSYNPAMVGRSASLETDGLLTSNSKLQQEVVFKILCSYDRVGGVIGRGGSIVHALQEESGANISTGSPVANCNDRLVTISSMEDVDSRYSPAQRAVVLVYSRSIEVGAERGFEAGLNKGSSVSARLVVPSSQVGCLLRKGGVIISEIRKATGTSIHIHNGDQVPKCVAQDDEVVEISGQFVNTQDALYHVTSRLRKNLFTSTHVRVRDETTVGLRQSSGTSQSIGGQVTLRQGLDRMSCPPISHFSPSIGLRTFETAGVNPMNFVTTDRGLASDNGGVELVRTQRPDTVTKTAVEILVPESSICSVYGENLGNLTRIRQISGAKVTVHEAIPGMKNRTVVISGTPDETQTAQSLIHAFILSG